MSGRFSADWLWAIVVAIVLVLLSVLDLDDGSFSRWSADHPFFTSAVTGILVLLVTVLIVDRVVAMREERSQSRAISAQATIVMAQAARASQAVEAALEGSGGRDAAGDELRTYLVMLSVGAPVLMGAHLSRDFLEAAQALGGEMTVALSKADDDPAARSRLDAAITRLRAESAPLLAILDPEHHLEATIEGLEAKPGPGA